MKVLKKVFSLLMLLALAMALFSCGNGAKGSMQETEKIDEVNLEKNIKGKKIAVVYLTVDDQVQTVAEEFATEFDADIFEIIRLIHRVQRDDDHVLFLTAFELSVLGDPQ